MPLRVTPIVRVLSAIRRGLVAEYLFIEGSGTTLHDTSGNGHHGNIVGMKWGVLGNGKHYLYNDQYPASNIAYVDLGVIDLGTGDLAIEMVVYIESWSKTYADNKLSAIMVGYPVQVGYLHVKLTYYNKGVQVSGRCADDNTWSQFTGMIFGAPDGTWLHLLFVRREGRGYAYMNGELVDNGRELEKPNAHMLYHFYIGRQLFNGLDYCGRIALLRMWKGRAPTDNEVKTLYQLAKLMVPDLG